MRVLPVVNINLNQGSLEVTRKNESMLPPQSVPVGGRLCQFVEGWKHITNDPYVFSIVAKDNRLRFTSPPLLLQTPWEIQFLKGSQKIQGMWEQISLMIQKNAISEISPDTPGFYSNVFLVRKASGGRRPVIDLKQLNHHIDAPHFRMHTISSVLEYRQKRRLHIQNRSEGCVLSCTNTSRQQEVPMFCLRKQSISVSSTSLRSEHCCSGIYSPGTYNGSLPPLTRDIGNPVSRRLANTSSRPSSVITPPVSVIAYNEHGRP